MLRKIIILVVVATVASLVVASAASMGFINNGAQSQAGNVAIGSGTVISLGASEFDWNILDADPEYTASVSFTIASPIADEVWARGQQSLYSDGSGGPGAAISSWVSCTNSGTVWTCPVVAPIAPLSYLQVSAAE